MSAEPIGNLICFIAIKNYKKYYVPDYPSVSCLTPNID